MKKWMYLISGILIGVIIATSGSAAAAQIKSLVGQKVTGELNVVINGEKLEEKGAVINGKTNAPVRAISDAIGGKLDLKGDTIYITTEDSTVVPAEPTESVDDLATLKQERETVAKEITQHENAITTYEEKYIPNTERAVKMTEAPTTKQGYTEQLDKYKTELNQYKSELADLQKQLAEIDVKIAELNK
ncbi:hypothetical protein M3201_18670 [Paenibacillus motobuensis]|uniref:hypothetical protein n=1 Tax=Paenibacillus TaxID=44249 RepID=UPI00203E5C62|nr:MULTISPECIES: hypothetical protein [Paenibacillus]MCM3041721.1 hypothetical protein [Paenibacillus lutimineralis]MCM3648825.1 hypothetical protein [Paenibacillus motobuensis]